MGAKDCILVTGGMGYLGSILVRDLLAAGRRVRILERFLFGLDAIKDVINNPNLDVVIGDVRDERDREKALAGDVGAVVHLAAIVGDPACAVDINLAIETNYLATIRLVDMCVARGVPRFLFASTCSVYGASDDRVLTEESPLNPISLYAETKLDAERKALATADDGFAPTVMRFGTMYGLSPRMRFDLAINFLTQKVVREGGASIFGGEQWRPFIHVRDAARAVAALLEAPSDAVSGRVFNVGGNEENYRMETVGNILDREIPGATIDRVEEVRDQRSYRASFDRVKGAVGFEPTLGVGDGIREIAAAVREGRFPNPLDDLYLNYKVR